MSQVTGKSIEERRAKWVSNNGGTNNRLSRRGQSGQESVLSKKPKVCEHTSPCALEKGNHSKPFLHSDKNSGIEGKGGKLGREDHTVNEIQERKLRKESDSIHREPGRFAQKNERTEE